jgi:DNA-binding MarR family transcriptional regulator
MDRRYVQYAEVISTFKLISNHLDTKLEKQSHSNLTRCRILNYLIKHQECSQTELQKDIDIDRAAITRHLKILEQHGDISRTRNSDNQRENRIQITEQGRITSQSCQINHWRFYEQLFKNIKEEHVGSLSDYLKQVKSNLDLL